MKKIPSLFVRDQQTKLVTNSITPGCEWVIEGLGQATRKHDGTCCRVKEGRLFKRYDAKQGKTPPPGFEAAQEPDYACNTCSWCGTIQTNATQESNSKTGVFQKVVEEETGARPDLHQLSETPRQKMPSMPQEVSRQKKDDILRPELCAEGTLEIRESSTDHAEGEHRETFVGTQAGKSADDFRLHSGIRADASKGTEGVCSATQAGHGENHGQTSDTMGSGSSSERGEGRQPTGESRTADKANTQGSSSVPALCKNIPDSIVCPRCGGQASFNHHPGWLPVGDDAGDQWHREALNAAGGTLPDGTYELCGPKIQGNPERLPTHQLIPHGCEKLDAPRTFDEIKAWLADKNIEGIVWHHHNGRMVKIKTRDFGMKRMTPNEKS